MWSLKFKVLNKDSIYTLLTAKYKVIDYLYPVDYYKKGNKIFQDDIGLSYHILKLRCSPRCPGWRFHFLDKNNHDDHDKKSG